ncbi:sensor histidine kinase, partial [Anaerolinea sp.]
NWTLPPRHSGHLLAILQEALSNVVRHSGASRVTLHLHQDEKGNTLLILEDDGTGLPAQIREGYGLRNMRERARMMGGTLTLSNRSPEKGTRLALVIPPERTSPPEWTRE